MDKLNELRKKIDVLDTILLQTLFERLLVVDDIGKVKKKLGLQPLDPTRWKIVLEKGIKQGEQRGLRREFIKKILETIHEEALLIERQ